MQGFWWGGAVSLDRTLSERLIDCQWYTQVVSLARQTSEETPVLSRFL